jgi:hypothetical protein
MDMSYRKISTENDERQMNLVVFTDSDLEMAGFDPSTVDDDTFESIGDRIACAMDGGDDFICCLAEACSSLGVTHA